MIEKVCVRIPVEKRDELMNLAKFWREEAVEAGRIRPPGWDAKAIHAVIGDNYGNLETCFKVHGWPERGSEMMQKVQAHVKREYGSVEAFVKASHSAKS